MGLHKRVTEVVAEDKQEVLDSCVVAWFKGGLRERALIEELRRAETCGCLVMRIFGAMVLLMFATTKEHQALLDRTDLIRWFARTMSRSPEIWLDSRSIWFGFKRWWWCTSTIFFAPASGRTRRVTTKMFRALFVRVKQRERTLYSGMARLTGEWQMKMWEWYIGN
ncbi:hypothetical protein V6N13_004741 [Hibiscus sabdariffa]